LNARLLAHFPNILLQNQQGKLLDPKAALQHLKVELEKKFKNHEAQKF